MDLPILEVGSTMIMEERWHELLWSAVPHRVINSSRTELITYVPTGAIATRASNRGLSGTEHLNREERWSRVNLGWDHTTGEFRGWYINFELPATTTPTGMATMDLVVDIWVNPDRSWECKDRDDFLAVLNDHTLDPEIHDQVETETAQVLRELEARSGPFADTWLEFRPNPKWSTPILPQSHAWCGSAWFTCRPLSNLNVRPPRNAITAPGVGRPIAVRHPTPRSTRHRHRKWIVQRAAA